MTFLTTLMTMLLASSLAFAADAPPPDEMQTVIGAITEVVDCELVGVHLVRFNLITAASILLSADIPAEAKKKLATNFADHAQEASAMVVLADSTMTKILMPRAKELGLGETHRQPGQDDGDEGAHVVRRGQQTHLAAEPRSAIDSRPE